MNDTGVTNAAAAYEQLRHDVLQGSPHDGHFGLILLMRDGVAAWIDHGVSVVTPAAASTNRSRAVALPALFPQVHAGIVDVLVNIALKTREEIHP